MIISKIRYINHGTTQHFSVGPPGYGVTTVYNTNQGMYVFYADRKLTTQEMISAIVTNNIMINEYFL